MHDFYSQFPDDFLWGCALAAHQCEGLGMKGEKESALLMLRVLAGLAKPGSLMILFCRMFIIHLIWELIFITNGLRM